MADAAPLVTTKVIEPSHRGAGPAADVSMTIGEPTTEILAELRNEDWIAWSIFSTRRRRR